MVRYTVMSSVPTIDFHGKKLQHAKMVVHGIVNEVRLLNFSTEYRFITGHGIIKREIIKFLKEDYGIEAREELGNSGIIRAYIE